MKTIAMSLVALLAVAVYLGSADAGFFEHGSLGWMARQEGLSLSGMLALLVVALWRGVPFPVWRSLHRNMPVAYLLLTVYASMLAPSLLLAPDGFWSDAGFWTQPEGLFFAMFLALSALAGLVSLVAMFGSLPQPKEAGAAVSNY